MARFLISLVVAALAAGVTYAATDSPGWASVAGVFGGLLVWAGPPAFEFLADVIDDL